MNLTCEHDDTKLKEEKTKSGTIYRCGKCLCTYRLMVAVNNKDCWNKRFPIKKQENKNELNSTNTRTHKRRNRTN